MVGVAYRGFLMDVPVNSWIEQYSLSVSGFVKTVGVETGVLDPLFIENDLLVTGDDHKDRRINDAVIIEARSARSAASKLLDGVEDSNGDVIAKTLTSKRVLLLSLDPNFKVEEAFWTSLRGERGLKALQSRILKCLPNDGAPKSLEASIQAMDTLAQTPVFEYCGRGVAGQFDTILGWPQSMKNGRSPNFGSGLDGDFLQQVLRRLAFFCSWSTSAGSSGGGLLYGKQAIEKIMETVLAKETQDGVAKLGLSDVRPLHVFNWLLTPDQKETTRRLTDAILASAGVASVTAKKETDVEPDSKKRRTSKVKDDQSTVVAGYFD